MLFEQVEDGLIQHQPVCVKESKRASHYDSSNESVLMCCFIIIFNFRDSYVTQAGDRDSVLLLGYKVRPVYSSTLNHFLYHEMGTALMNQ